MEEACGLTEGGMAAMIGGELDSIRALANDCGVDVANLNAPGQVVLSGSKDGIATAVARCRDFGVRRAVELQVAGAYHSRLMASAEEKLAKALRETDIREPAFPVICNVEARTVENPEDVRRTLAAQVTGSVRWEESMRLLLAEQPGEFLELGPGGVLSGLLRKTERAANVRSLSTVEDFEAAAMETAAAEG